MFDGVVKKDRSGHIRDAEAEDLAVLEHVVKGGEQLGLMEALTVIMSDAAEAWKKMYDLICISYVKVSIFGATEVEKEGSGYGEHRYCMNKVSAGLQHGSLNDRKCPTTPHSQDLVL